MVYQFLDLPWLALQASKCSTSRVREDFSHLLSFPFCSELVGIFMCLASLPLHFLKLLPAFSPQLYQHDSMTL